MGRCYRAGSAVFALLFISGCQSSLGDNWLQTGYSFPVPNGTQSDTQKPNVPNPSESPTSSSLDPAPEQLELFKQALVSGGAGTQNSTIDGILASLISAGFPPEKMTHTELETPTGLNPESISVAVNLGGHCLVGQYSSSWVEVAVLPVLQSGCLIGSAITPFP